MGTTRIVITRNSRPTEAQLQQIEAASKMPVTYDEDCPPLTPEQQDAFAALAKLRGGKNALRSR